MRRADRLFQIIQILRRTRKPPDRGCDGGRNLSGLGADRSTATSPILNRQRVPIRGELGFGYVLEKTFDLPALMLTPDEIEAAVLGAQWVAGHGDAVLARAAARPDRQDHLHRSRSGSDRSLCSSLSAAPGPAGICSPIASTWRGRECRFATRPQENQHNAIAMSTAAAATARIWSIIIGYYENVRLLAAWCELRQDFRQFPD